MVIEKTVTIDLKTGQIREVKIKEYLGEDPTSYREALVNFYVSALRKNKEEKGDKL